MDRHEFDCNVTCVLWVCWESSYYFNIDKNYVRNFLLRLEYNKFLDFNHRIET